MRTRVKFCGMTRPGDVRLATLEWEPYIGQKMPDQGYCAALIRAAFATQGMTVDIQFYPWERALHLARTGARKQLADLAIRDSHAGLLRRLEQSDGLGLEMISLRGNEYSVTRMAHGDPSFQCVVLRFPPA